MNRAKRNSLELLRHLLASVLSALIALGPAGLAFAGPQQIKGGNGKGTVTRESDKVWVVTASNGAIIKYSSFDIARDELVRFQKTGDKAGLVRVLNRIDSKAPTQINGAITQQGGTFMIYIVNPAGVFFGADAKINVTGLQAAAGNLSTPDFERGIDHFTNLKGKVENAAGSGEDETAGIFANAVSLVGRNVVNSGTIATDGWIVMAAGRDVFIGRDGNGNGLLLRVEGGADAVFNKSAKGVTNTGSLSASDRTDEAGKIVPGRISLGAGDLYGTAIFNTGAIQAREIALQASNKGNVALAGEVKASTLGITLGGDKAGKLVGAAAGQQTLNADVLNLTATGAKGQVVVGERFELRSNDGTTNTANVNVEQRAVLTTSNLAKLELGSPGERADTKLALKSASGIIVDDRELVTGTRLTVEAPATVIQGARDPLEVEQLDLESRFVQTESDLIVNGEDRQRPKTDPNDLDELPVFDHAMHFTGNLEVVTKPGGAGGAGLGTVLSATKGTISTVGDIVTTDGGGLEINAADVKLGTLNADGTLTGGSIVSSGSRAAGVRITAKNSDSTLDDHLLGSVQAKSIVTSAGVTVPGVDQAVGGDVTIDATGDITLFGDILTVGGAPLVAGNPLHDGGSVSLTSQKTLTVHNIITGGARNPSSDDVENGNIDLTGKQRVVLAGNLDAAGGDVKNDNGERNRRVEIHGPVQLDADRVTVTGGTVVVDGAISEGEKPDPNDPNGVKQIPRHVDLLFDVNRLTMVGDAHVRSLDILARDTRQTDAGVFFNGNVVADDFVHLTFDAADGVARWGTDTAATVTAPNISVTAIDLANSLTGGGATVELDPALQFNLTTPANDANDPIPPRAQFSLWQSSAIDSATINDLFVTNRFGDGNSSLAESVLLLRTNSAMTFDQSALDHVNAADTNLKLIADRFSVTTTTGTPTFDVDSFELTTFGNLTADFDVFADGTDLDQGIGLHAGATGVGNLDVSGKLQGRSILLIAGDGTDVAEGGHREAAITIDELARFSDPNGTEAPKVFGLQQDASIATNAEGLLPDRERQFGGSIAGMQYRLESADGDVSLETGAVDEFEGTNLVLNGQTGVDLGSEALTLTGLDAQTRGSMTVSTAVTVHAEDPNDGIRLSAGQSGAGQLTVNSKLTADRIDLSAAGVGDAAGGSIANIVLADAASFAGDSTTPIAPKHFGMVQDASLAQTEMPTRDAFTGSLDGMEFELRSLGGQLSLSDPTLVDKTALVLEGRSGIDIKGSLTLASLDAKGALTTDGSITTTGIITDTGTITNTGDLSIDTTQNGIERVVTLNGTGEQSLVSNGALTVKGRIAKTTAGDVVLNSGKELTVGDVATAHTGGHIGIDAGGKATIGALDASGRDPNEDPNEPTLRPAVRVTGAGEVEIASINARGKSGSTGQKGENGGNVVVSGTALRLGTIDASGGNGGSTSSATETTHGGDAGSIELTDVTPNDGTAFEVSILGDLLAVGGAGAARDANVPLLPLRGDANDVHVGGSLLLLAQAGDGPTNAIRGSNVKIDGVVDAPGTGNTPRGTGLRIVADESLEIDGGSIRAGTLDLEVHTGNLDLGQKTIYADSIRLAATDGAGGVDDAVVDVDQLTLWGARRVDPNDPLDEQPRITSLTLEQDAGFGGANGGAIPNVNDFEGVDADPNSPAISLGLISQDGTITLDPNDLDNVADTRLTLAANEPIQINGAGKELSLRYLQLGSVVGVGAGGVGVGSVGGDTNVEVTQLTVGDPNAPSNDALRAYGDLTVTGDMNVLGTARFAGEGDHGDQLLRVTGKLEIAGSDVSKTTNGALEIDASQGIDLTAQRAQTISNEGGRLVLHGGLIKGSFKDVDADGDGNLDPEEQHRDNDPNAPLVVGQRGLSLRGVSEDPDEAAVEVIGTKRLNDTPADPNSPAAQREYAIAIANGDLSISAVRRDPGSSTTSIGEYELGGDVLAFGDVVLSGQGSFHGKPSYTVEAQRNPNQLAGELLSGELTMGGVSSADGNLRLIARGDDPSFDIAHPSAIHLKGNFAGLAGALEVDGSVDFPEDTSINAAGDVVFHGVIQGEHGLSVQSSGQVVLADDVALTAGALSLAGNSGVRFTSASDTQFVQAGSISLGSGATRTPSGAATLVRDGNLSLAASGGDVAIANGQRMVVNGSLSVSAKRRISLTDTAALRIKLISQDLIVRSGSTVMANSIVSTATPRVTSGGVATFAVPTRTEVTDNIPSDQILLRQINADGSPLSLASSFPEGVDPESVEFQTVPFPVVSGPAQFDYARQTPLPPLRQPQTRPHVDVKDLDASLANRPLWADELLAYLEQRSVETPGVSEAVEHLPPVGARPGDPLEAEDRRVRGAAAERAVALYRELFRPDVARNRETGFIDEPGRAAAIRAAFQQPIDALRRENGGKPVSGAALRELIASTPSFAPAQSYTTQLGQLVAAGELALTPDQKPRWSGLVLSDVMPYGIAPAEFATAIR